jgi:hypothetical protein
MDRALAPRIKVRILVPQPATFFIRRNHGEFSASFGCGEMNVLANNQIVAHPVEACWVAQSKNWDREAMPWLKQ